MCIMATIAKIKYVSILDHDIDDLEMQVVRYKPEGLDILCRNTKFTKKELQIMYRGFKQVCVLILLILSSVISLMSYYNIYK